MDSSGAMQTTSNSLHDDFMTSLQATNMMDYARQIDMIQDGQLADGARLGDDMRAWSMDGPNMADQAPGLSDGDVKAGELLALEAQIACEEAISAAEMVKKRQRESMESYVEEDSSGMATPSKRQRTKRGGTVRSTEHSGRSGSKGLRHFSMKVCEKVESKGRTTYNEVADELVNDLPNGNDPASPGGMQYDEKNIRRRVYDALNVLMAMGIITKEKKEIFWKGLPQGPQLSLDRLKGERQRLIQKLDQQRRYIAELTTQQAQFRALMRRNKDQTVEQLMLGNATGSSDVTALPLPFVLIQVDRTATIEIKIADDNRQAEFDFDASPFKITGDEQVLQEMSLVDHRDPYVSRAHIAAADALSPRPTHHPQSKSANGLASASNRAHPQLPPTAKPARPGGNPTGSPPPFNLAHLPAAQLAALNNMARGDLGLLGNVAAAAQGADWMRSAPGMGSPNFRMPTSPMMLRPPGSLGGMPNGGAPTLAQQLALSLNPNAMLGPSVHGSQPSPKGLLQAAASQAAGGLQPWAGMGQHTHQGNHARLLHGSPLSQSILAGPGALNGASPSSAGLRPSPSGPFGVSHMRPGAAPLVSQQPPTTASPQLGSQPLPKFSSDLLRPSPGLPQASAAGPLSSSVLNAAWLGSLQKPSLPQGPPLSTGPLLSQPLSAPSLSTHGLQNQPADSQATLQGQASPLGKP